jgi:hypothetical protein
VLSVILVALLQTPPPQAAKPENPGEMLARTSWTGCLQSGTTPSSYRLNLDAGTAVAGPDDPASFGGPFVQLLGNLTKLGVSSHVGKHVQITGKELSREEAEREAALRPDKQEANETASGTSGRPQRHLRYVRVESIKAAPGGACR